MSKLQTHLKEWFKGTDAHCPLPGHTETNFKTLEEIAQLLAGKWLNVTVYWYEYVSLMGANVTSLSQIVKDFSDPNKKSSRLYLHQPDIDKS